MIKTKLIAVITILFFIFLVNCEELEEYLTKVSGKVYADDCKVVLAVKGETDLFYYLNNISGIDEVSLRDAEIFRGYDLSIGNDSLYSITMLSFGETYFLAILDNGLIVDELDTLDQVGFYGESDTITISVMGTDSLFTYTIPQRMNVQDRFDESDIDIENFIEFRWFILIDQQINP